MREWRTVTSDKDQVNLLNFNYNWYQWSESGPRMFVEYLVEFPKWKWFIYLLYLPLPNSIMYLKSGRFLLNQNNSSEKLLSILYTNHEPVYNIMLLLLFVFHSINLRCWAHVVLKTFPVIPFSLLRGISLIFNNNVFIFHQKMKATKVCEIKACGKSRVFSWVEYYFFYGCWCCCFMVLWNVLSENPHNHNHESSRKIENSQQQ